MSESTATSQPNILLIMTDQQAPGMMSCTGTSWLHTPVLDGLAARGVRFEHAVCANPVCVPSRMSMATGMMPARFGVDDNANGMSAVLPQAVVEYALGNLMKRAGYATFYGGKVHMCDQLSPTASGYDRYHRNERETLADSCVDFIATERSKPYFAVASFINPHDICYVHNAKVERDPSLSHVTDLFRQADELPDELLPPLPENYAVPDGEPAGMRSRTNDTAITPSGTMYQTYTERDWRIYRWVYARLTEAVDAQIGRILTAVDWRRVDDRQAAGGGARGSGRAGGAVAGGGAHRRTVVIFVSDHGNMHANHGLASKGVFYEESVRVPFIIADGDSIPGGRVDTTTLVNTGLDILPTCCDYAGIPAPESCLGVSVRSSAEGQSGAAAPEGGPPAHAYVASENDHGRMIRTDRYKYTVYAGAEPREILTDLVADGGELHNLAADGRNADLLAQHRRMMRDWFEKSGDDVGLREFVVV